MDDHCRGHAVGCELLSRAIQFCDEKDFPLIHLRTFKGLDAARKLYEAFDFKLVEEETGAQWGTPVTEQKFTRIKPIKI